MPVCLRKETRVNDCLPHIDYDHFAAFAMESIEEVFSQKPTFGKKVRCNISKKYDLITGNSQIHDFGENCEIGEAVFAPKENAQQEDEGYVMLFVYYKNNNKSDFVILDAQNFTGKPLAKIKLSRRVPHGLHGSWISKSPG